jgi:Flp pilus assembly protein TadD
MKPAEMRIPTLSESGTISVRELAQPLEGNGLKMLRKAKELLAQGEVAQGMDELRSAMRDAVAEPYALAMLGGEHLKRGDFDTAIKELEEAAHLSPGMAATQSNLAYALSAKGRNEEALGAARKALQLDPGRPKIRFVLAAILMELGRWSEAEYHLRKAADENAGARKLLAKYFNPAGQAH